MNSIWLSVIIPVYNCEKYLEKCLKSISMQAFNNFEVIMVDDGSTDSSMNICKKYASLDIRFKYYRIENSGPLAARIYGSKKANGCFFTYCDADDYYISNNVFAYLYDLISNSYRNISIVQFGFKKQYNHIKSSVSQINNILYCDKDVFYLQQFPSLLCNNWESSFLDTLLWDKIYNHKLLNCLPDNIENRVFWGEDLIINLYLLQSIDSALFISDNLYVYRQFSGGTSKFSLNTMKDLDFIKINQIKFLSERKIDDVDRIKRDLYAEIAAWFLLYIKDATKYLNDEELNRIINETLQLPTFILARNYFNNENQENWEAVNLLRKGDVQNYVLSGKKIEKQSFKNIMNYVLKYLYKHI